MESGFHLAKWYVDCIAEEGRTVIGYSARLTWRSVTMNYSSLLRCGPARPPETSSSLFSSDVPVIRNETALWNCKELELHGQWKQRSVSVERTLLQNEDGYIRWSCLMPGAEASVTVADETVSGFGYVEFLEMTLPPWKLPIDELRWGRFVTQKDSVVWIDWKGPHPLRTVFHNGSSIDCTVVNDSMIFSGNEQFSLTLDRGSIIRSGALINTALKKVPMLDRIMPKNILLTDECKWLSKGILNSRGDSSNGYSIHEAVRFL